MALTLKYEVAFNAGYATPAASRTWTDITSYVVLSDGVDIQFGRRDELSTSEPNTLSLTLDNRDGRFTPERSSSPYYPNVKLYRPIRVTATLPDASTSVRFLGYVTEWPTSWPDGSDAYSSVSITAVSRMARLGDTTQLRSMLSAELTPESPIALYALDEADGAAIASDSSGQSAPSLASRAAVVGAPAPIVFGAQAAPGFDGATAVTFAGGNYLGTTDGTIFVPYSAATFEMWAKVDTLPASGVALLASTSELRVTVDSAGSLGWLYSLSAGPSSGVISTGVWHHVAVTLTASGTLLTLYLDGVSVGTIGGVGMTINGNVAKVGGGIASPGYFTLTGSMSTVALSSTGASAARILAHYQAGTTGFAGEATGDRLKRIASYGGVDPAEVTTGGGVAIGTQGTSGKTVLDALRDVEATEGSVVYDERIGFLTMAARTDRYYATAGLTLDASAQQVQPDYAPTYDAAKLQNDVTFSGPSLSARSTSQSSINDYGSATSSGSTLASSDDEPGSRAAWQVFCYSEPRTRVPVLTVDVLGLPSASATAAAAATVGTLITVNNLPQQAAASSASYFVEGYTERFSPESWEITFNVSPAAPYTSTWQLDSATRSQLGTTTLLAL